MIAWPYFTCWLLYSLRVSCALSCPCAVHVRSHAFIRKKYYSYTNIQVRLPCDVQEPQKGCQWSRGGSGGRGWPSVLQQVRPVRIHKHKLVNANSLPSSSLSTIWSWLYWCASSSSIWLSHFTLLQVVLYLCVCCLLVTSWKYSCLHICSGRKPPKGVLNWVAQPKPGQEPLKFEVRGLACKAETDQGNMCCRTV
jgi:hypothetical protein